jgi:gliding motility-associated-like protein
MRIKNFLYLFIFLFFLLQGRAGTIVVTSNADSGPGTLREAITTANGNGTTVFDTILFNISDISQAGRTINLLSPLPSLTSKLIIDASQQNGNTFGVSNSKVIISFSNATLSFTYFEIKDCVQVEIYSIFFLQPLLTGNIVTSAISILHSDTIQIGAPGKGNYFMGCQYGIRGNTSFSVADSSHNVKIKSNVFGLNENGIATDSFQNNRLSYVEQYINLRNMDDVEIGGINTNEGNRLGTSGFSFFGDLYKNGTLRIQNNFWGTNYDGTENVFNPNDCWMSINTSFHDDMKVIFNNNILNGKLFLIYIGQQGFELKNNIIFSNKITSSTDFRIYLQSCSKGIIGGDTPSEGNIIRSNYNNPFYYFSPWNKQWSIRNDGSNVTVRNNVMLCNSYYGSSLEHYLSGYDPSACQIDSTGINYVRGKATPNSRVDVYLDDDCLACEGKLFLGFTLANPDSTWSFAGSFNQTVVATSTNLLGKTSEFSHPLIFPTDLTRVKNPTCGQNNGSIKNLATKGADNVIWRRFYMINNIWYDSVISTSLNIDNIGPGRYAVEARLGATCRSAFQIFDLSDVTPSIDEANANITHPSCGLFNGSITNVAIANSQYSVIEWKNELGTIVSNNLDLINAGPGRYKLYLTDTTSGGGCSDSTTWFDLINQSGPTLNINNLIISNATCGNANGSITGITTTNVTGSPFIQWLDSLNNPVGSNLDLTNIAAGKYRLKFKDQSGCDTIITPFYTIQSFGIISIDSSQMIVNASGCTTASGTVTGLTVTGATTYQWVNAAGLTISNTLVPGNLYPGAYVLIATNTYGCEKRTDSIRISVTNAAMTFNPPLQVQSASGKCNNTDGFINILNFPNAQNYTFRWIDSLQPTLTINNSLNLSGINSGSYILYAKNAAGCEQRVLNHILPYQPPPVIAGAAIITDEVCNNRAGSIQGLSISANTGISPFSYAWYDAGNNVISSQQSLQNVSAGNYRLVVRDNNGCSDTSLQFQVRNTIVQLTNPRYDDQYVKINTPATLTVLNPQQTTYLLFDSPSATAPIQQNNTGVFITAPLTTDKTFYIQQQVGNCSSARTAVKIFVYDKTNIFVPSAFTPNNDGRNDLLKVKAYGIVSLDYFRVYNKWGQLVFSTKDISKGWDGLVNGIMQTTSVFVWMVRAKDEVTSDYIEKKGTVLMIK